MRTIVSILAGLLLAAPATAEVMLSDQGFVTRNSISVPAAPQAVWEALLAPARYWDPAHSYSGAAANFSLDPRAGGCFCERLADGGSIEHLRVVLVMPPRTLRLAGALGPLQSEGVAGALTWQIEPAEGGGSRITQTYVVGGHMRLDRATTAPLVDQVLRQQLERLAALFSRRP